ncbi:MAG: tetratricopeptide repeat protein [Myxococcales bacterium]|nr:tetratricopeptide repeat protein [Myxococcales bacterium]
MSSSALHTPARGTEPGSLGHERATSTGASAHETNGTRTGLASNLGDPATGGDDDAAIRAAFEEELRTSDELQADDLRRSLKARLFGKPRDPTRVGRYIIDARIGQGGMSVVYRARDPELNRVVAIKLLRGRETESARTTSRRHRRLLREAEALARLSHPNVVTVYDVGVHEDQVFIAMDLVRGTDLKRWRLDQKPGWREAVRVFIEAGKGLAAAHDADLVHRDFKPANVLIGDDGRVQVIDFGLVKRSDSSASDDHTLTRERRDTPTEVFTAPGELAGEGTVTGSAFTDDLTRAGAMLGTFAYMAPEQFTHAQVDALTDQFSFFVALYEVLYGQRPFAARSREELAYRVVEGVMVPPPKGRAIPRWLRKICLRGLSTDPRRRYPTMRAALDALERGLARRGRRALALAFTGALAATALLAFGGGKLLRGGDPCAASQHEYLDAAAVDELRGAVLGTELPYAERTWSQLERSLETLADERTRAAQITCVDRSQRRLDEHALQLRERCLADVDREVAALAGDLLDTPKTVTPDAIDRVAELPDPTRCLDDAVLARAQEALGTPRVRDARRDELTQLLREQLDAVARSERDGDYNHGLALARAATDAADNLGDTTLRARAWHLRGSLELLTGDAAAARSSHDKSARLSERFKKHPLWVRTIADRIASMALAEARLDDGAWWALEAQRAIDHLAHSGVAEGDLLASIGTLHESRGEYDKALDFQQRALQLRARSYGDEHPKVAESLSDLGALLTRLERYDEALASLQRALEIRRAAFGEQHPRVAASLNNLGALYISTGELEAAERAHQQALEIKRQTLGEHHPSVAVTRHNLGWLAHKRERYEDALTQYQAALEILERVVPDDHPDLALTLNAMGVALKRLGRLDEALVAYRRALEIRARALPEHHPQLATSHNNLGKLQLARGRPRDAADHFARALEIRERTLDAEDPGVAKALRLLGQARLESSDPAGARVVLERALALDEKNTRDGHESAEHLAETRFALARALVESGGDNGARGSDELRAAQLAQAAREFYARDPEGFSRELSAVDAWTLQR